MISMAWLNKHDWHHFVLDFFRFPSCHRMIWLKLLGPKRSKIWSTHSEVASTLGKRSKGMPRGGTSERVSAPSERFQWRRHRAWAPPILDGCQISWYLQWILGVFLEDNPAYFWIPVDFPCWSWYFRLKSCILVVFLTLCHAICSLCCKCCCLWPRLCLCSCFWWGFTWVNLGLVQGLFGVGLGFWLGLLRGWFQDMSGRFGIF